MGTEGARQSEFAKFDELIPGCNWEILRPYDRPIKAGIRATQERLSGKRWLVAALIWSMGWDMIHEEIRLDAAFDDSEQAWERAQQWQQDPVVEYQAANGGACQGPEPAEWPDPRNDPIVAGPIRRVPTCCVYREYWDYGRIHVAVLPLDPVAPVSNAWMHMVDCDSGLHKYFREVGESLGFGVRPPPRILEPSAKTGSSPKPQGPSNPWDWRWVLYLIGGALGAVLYSILR